MTDISNIVLFKGTLEELNSINPSKQYKIAGTEFMSRPHYKDINVEVKKELREQGYDGLIHKETIYEEKVLFIWPSFWIEGVPIKIK